MYHLFGEDIDSIMLFYNRMCFQSIFEVSVAIKNKKDNRLTRQYAIALSDDGATLNFASSQFIQKFAFRPIGIWCGMLKTLTNFEEIQSPIFRIDLVLNQSFGNCLVPIAAISTDDIGFREGASEQVMLAVPKMFQVDYKRSLSNPHGPIDLLIGLDDQRLLRKDMTAWMSPTLLGR